MELNVIHKKEGKQMRLIDADELQEMCFSNGLNEDGILYVPFGEVMQNIRNMPTAYDIEKVIEEIKSLSGYEIYKNTFDSIIDIVKKGVNK